MRFVTAAQVDTVPAAALLASLEDAIANPATFDAAVPRSSCRVTGGELLLMPAGDAEFAGVKVVSVSPDNPARALPRIQGLYLLFEADTLTPCAVIDAIALTAVRTAAMSMFAIGSLGGQHASNTVVVGTGVQARSHLRLLGELGWGGRKAVLGRRTERVRSLVAEAYAHDVRPGHATDLARADLAIFCTSATSPVVTAADLASEGVVVAVGSHSPDHAELAADVFAGATVLVEDIPAALCEAGDVIQALAAGALMEGDLLSLRQAVSPRNGRRIFKSVGMAWEDLAVAAAVFKST